MVPVPVYKSENNVNVNQNIVNTYYSKLIPDIAIELGLSDNHVIDTFRALKGPYLSWPEYFCDKFICDGVHPTNKGY
jgi:hypothetical protein